MAGNFFINWVTTNSKGKQHHGVMFKLYKDTFRDQLKQTSCYSGTLLRNDVLELFFIMFSSIKVYLPYKSRHVILCVGNFKEKIPV
jgi:hypothetical protein